MVSAKFSSAASRRNRVSVVTSCLNHFAHDLKFSPDTLLKGILMPQRLVSIVGNYSRRAICPHARAGVGPPISAGRAGGE
jgi:hypothetical protein